MPSLIHCIYASAAICAFDTPALAKLLAKARDDNNRLGITGMLLYTGGSFFQVLEGRPAVVNALYAKIELDKRHDRVTQIISEPIPMRSFDAWTMGFSTLSRDEVSGILGVNDFFNEGESFADIGRGRAMKLLTAFRDGRWRMKLCGARSLVHP